MAMNSLGRELESFDSDDLQVQEVGLTSMLILTGQENQVKVLLSENERLTREQVDLQQQLDSTKKDSEAKIQEKDEQITDLKAQLEVRRIKGYVTSMVLYYYFCLF